MVLIFQNWCTFNETHFLLLVSINRKQIYDVLNKFNMTMRFRKTNVSGEVWKYTDFLCQQITKLLENIFLLSCVLIFKFLMFNILLFFKRKQNKFSNSLGSHWNNAPATITIIYKLIEKYAFMCKVNIFQSHSFLHVIRISLFL